MFNLNAVSAALTGNPLLLKDLDLETVLTLHPLQNAHGFNYVDVQKTKPIHARPINSILDKAETERSVFEKLLLGTLEGAQNLKRDAFVCWGIDDDVWQQSKKKLTDQYDIVDVDEDGWLLCNPKPESPRNGYKVTSARHSFGPNGGFAVINPVWGDRRVVSRSNLKMAGIDPEAAGLKSEGDSIIIHLHYGVDGDWVLQRKEDATDIYRVARSFFDNTHEVVHSVAH